MSTTCLYYCRSSAVNLRRESTRPDCTCVFVFACLRVHKLLDSREDRLPASQVMRRRPNASGLGMSVRSVSDVSVVNEVSKVSELEIERSD